MAYKVRPSGMQARLYWVCFGFGALCLLLIGRFFQLQVLDHRMYEVLASDQHEIQSVIVPRRGTIFVRDQTDGDLHPIARDRDSWLLYAVPREMKFPLETAKRVAERFGLVEEDLIKIFSVSNTVYAPLLKDVSFEKIEQLRTDPIRGIGVTKGQIRSYPEAHIGGHVLGFVAMNDAHERVGRYGIEGAFHVALAGKRGTLETEKDASGRRIPIGTTKLVEAVDGSDVILTIDRAIQYEACHKIEEGVKRYEAKSGSIVVMDPATGAVIAMCSTPDFSPERYGDIDRLDVLNNPVVSYQYEPGSIFKPFTMAAGIDAGKITDRTTYVDTGEEVIDGHSIRNSDKQAHGLQTMTQVLEKSLNTGTIFVQRLLGRETFVEYMRKFGFGEKTGIELPNEAKGDVAAFNKKGKIFAATASFGQGISFTPLQMAAAFGALANGGELMKPYIVEEIRESDGRSKRTEPQMVRRVIAERTAKLVSAMMVNVVENGHGKRAGVPGYYVAGKTGTAQIAGSDGTYLEGETIGSFAGFAPATHPKFVMLVKIDRPKAVQFAESSAAPLFGEMAKFLLNYYHIPPERPIEETHLPPLNPVQTVTSTR